MECGHHGNFQLCKPIQEVPPTLGSPKMPGDTVGMNQRASYVGDETQSKTIGYPAKHVDDQCGMCKAGSAEHALRSLVPSTDHMPCRFGNSCWRPLCPYSHSRERGRAQYLASLWTFLAQLSATKEKDVPGQDEESMTETLESNITYTKPQAAQSSAAQEASSQEQYEEPVIESSECHVDVKETTAFNDDSKEALQPSITQYEEFMTESTSTQNRTDMVKETTVVNDDSKAPVSSLTDTKAPPVEEFPAEPAPPMSVSSTVDEAPPLVDLSAESVPPVLVTTTVEEAPPEQEFPAKSAPPWFVTTTGVKSPFVFTVVESPFVFPAKSVPPKFETTPVDETLAATTRTAPTVAHAAPVQPDEAEPLDMDSVMAARSRVLRAVATGELDIEAYHASNRIMERAFSRLLPNSGAVWGEESA